ncbi:RHS repeat-associated core domain-containing protein [Methylocystis sp. JAN1]|uniref:RHS repeat-associated core domain-containing protein n=1 Tax=Methylocystis sp. JAN1 TaxID=3397211 RepID=UPI003FA34078
MQTGPAAAPSVVNRTLAWTGDVVDTIDDAINPGRSERLSYTPTRRLNRAKGMYGLLAWTYDANGNRATETGADGVISTYSYPADSNRLDSVTPAGGAARSFAYDASGDIIGDTRVGALGMSFEYDGEHRLSKAYQTNAPTSVATYGYDTLNRLVSRSVNGVTTFYIHDISNHIIAETDATGATLREYIWLGDLPVAVVAGVNTANPVAYYVHTDHLGRPVRMTSQTGAINWWAVYAPFGSVYATGGALSQDMRFPGQWFQIESGLAYNWNRHYDATLGRYLQPDPAGYAGGRNLYQYVGASPLAFTDFSGLVIGDFPPPPPGYDPATWTQGQWGNGRHWLRDSEGNTYTIHPEDEGHWRHWDKRDNDNNDQGMVPPNCGKPRDNQRSLKSNQSTSDPSGSSPPWTPKIVAPVVPVDPIPMMPPMIRIPIIRMPIPIIP